MDYQVGLKVDLKFGSDIEGSAVEAIEHEFRLLLKSLLKSFCKEGRIFPQLGEFFLQILLSLLRP